MFECVDLQVHTKQSKSDKDIYHMISLIRAIKNIIQMNLKTQQKQTHKHRKQTYGYQREKSGGRINQEFGINIHTLLYVTYIINEDLLLSTGNYTQYFVVTYEGKKSDKEYI